MKTDAAIHRIAGALLRDLGIESPPVEVEAVAESLGAVIRRESTDTEISGALYRLDTGPVIGVNEAHPAVRQRFTIAHELGHLMLHEQPVFVDRHYIAPPVRSRPSYLRDTKSSQAVDSLEIEANKFAAALLMPPQMIRKAIYGIPIPIAINCVSTLAKDFGVSEQAMGYRLVNLGIPTQQT